MVKRKPVNAGADRTSSGLPYPITPISPKKHITEAFASPLEPTSVERSQTPSEKPPPSNSSSGMANSTIAWAHDDIITKNTSNELPPALRVGEGRLPTGEAHGGVALHYHTQTGPVDGTPRSSFESQSSARHTADREQLRDSNQATLSSSVQSHNSNNPFLRMRDNHTTKSRASNVEGGSSADIWGETAGNSTTQNLEAQAPSESSHTPQIDTQHLRLT